MRRQTRTLTLAVSMAVAGIMPARFARAQDATWQDHLRHAQDDQEKLKTETTKVAVELDQIIASFKKNGLDNRSDVQTLIAVRAVLGKLSSDQMSQVIRILQDARGLDQTEALHAAADAHQVQNNIDTQLQTLLHQFEDEQQVSDLAARMDQLADRQNTNLQRAVQTVKETHGQPLHPGDDTAIAQVRVQSEDQDSLAKETNLALADLSALAQKIADTDKVKAALDAANGAKLAQVVVDAGASLHGSSLMKAASEEKSSRDAMRLVARILGMPQDTLGKLKQAQKEIDQEIAAQDKLTLDTKKSPLDKPAAADLEQRQADLVDHTDQTRKDLDMLAPSAAADLKKAEDQMQATRSDLNVQQRDPATRKQAEALAHLKQASQEVADQIRKEQDREKSSGDNLAKLQDLKRQIADAKKEQDALKSATATAKDGQALKTDGTQQKKLEDKTQDMKQQAAAASPDAAHALGDAAASMDKAQQDLNQQNTDAKGAQQEQQAASDNLDSAAKAVDKDLAKLEQAKAEEKQLDALKKKLQEIIAEQIRVGIDTGITAAKPDAPKIVTPKELAGRQTQIGGETEQFRKDLPETAKNAVAPLTDARTNMDTASADLAKSDAKGAGSPQKDALTDLYHALAALDQQIDQDKSALGEKSDPQKDMQNLAKDLDKAQQDLSKAQSELNQPAPTPDQQSQQQKDLAQIADQQKQIAQALDQMKQSPPAGADPQKLQQADQAAQQAAQDLKDNQLADAAQQMQKAQDAMQQAQPPQPPQPAQPQPGQPTPGQPTPGQPTPGQPTPGQPTPGQPTPGQPTPGQPTPGQI